jgi:hypothetical protein
MKNMHLSGLVLTTLATLAAVASPCRADDYNAIAPCRLVDTRGFPAALSIGTALVNGDERSIPLRNNGTTCTIPSTATAVVLNLTAVSATAAGHLILYEGGITRPLASNLNFAAGANAATANQAVVKLGAPDAVLYASVTNGGKTDVLIDVSGYFAPTGAKFHAMTPCRLLDTRPWAGNLAPLRPPQYTRLNTNQTIGLPVQNNGSSCTIPQGAIAVFANLTAVTPSGAGHLTLFPAVPKPNVSTLNFLPNDVIPNAVIVPLAAASPDLRLFAYASGGTVDALLDISGYFQ